MSEPHPIAKALRDMRIAAFLSQREVAERANVHQGSISEIERGLIQPTLATVERIADAFDYDVVLVPRERALRTEYAWCLGDPNEGVPVTGPEHVVRRLASMPSDKAGGSPGAVYVREVTEWRAES